MQVFRQAGAHELAQPLGRTRRHLQPLLLDGHQKNNLEESWVELEAEREGGVCLGKGMKGRDGVPGMRDR